MNRLSARRWAWLLPVLTLWLATSCTDSTNTLDDNLPTPQTGREAVYTDTVTVRSSTVLLDSVPSAAYSYLLAGRYVDASLGAIEARSYLQPGLSATFTPDVATQYDSLVLVLTTDTYRYGDTTQTQNLEVHRMQQGFELGKAYYTKDALTYDAASLGQRTFRARKALTKVRVKLNNALGQELWNAGLAGQLTTSDEIRARLFGLAVVPSAGDNAALVRFTAASDSLVVYYHDRLDPVTVLKTNIDIAGSNGHFYGLTANRTGTPLAPLTQPRQGLASTATGGNTYIEAGLGLGIRLEFPYLTAFRGMGSSFLISNANLTTEVISSTENRYLPPPTQLIPRLTDRVNRPGALFLSSSGSTVVVPYQRSASIHTGLDQGFYSLDLQSYITAVVAGAIVNNGILLTGETSGATTERVVLGSQTNTEHPLKVKLYYTHLL